MQNEYYLNAKCEICHMCVNGYQGYDILEVLHIRYNKRCRSERELPIMEFLQKNAPALKSHVAMRTIGD